MILFYLVMFLLPCLVILLAIWLVQKEIKKDA